MRKYAKKKKRTKTSKPIERTERQSVHKDGFPASIHWIPVKGERVQAKISTHESNKNGEVATPRLLKRVHRRYRQEANPKFAQCESGNCAEKCLWCKIF